MSETCTIGDLNYPDCDRAADAVVVLPFHAIAATVGGSPRTRMAMCAEHAQQVQSRFPDVVIERGSGS